MRNLFAIFFIYVVLPCFGQNIDSLKKIAASSHSTQKRIKAAVELADYFSSKNADEALSDAKAGLALATRSNDARSRGLLLQGMGEAYELKGRYDSTAYYLGQSAEVFDQLKDNTALAEIYNHLGKLYSKTRDYSKAIDCYNKVIENSPKTGSRQEKMIALDQIAALYEDQHSYREALNYYRQSFDIRDSLNLVQKSRDSTLESYSQDFIGDVFGSMKSDVKVEENLLKNIKTEESLNDTLSLAINYINLGIYYKQKNDYAKSLYALQHCLQYATAIQYTDLQSSALSALADLYEQNGNYQQSLVFLKRHMALSNTVHSGKNSKNLSELQNKYEITQKEDQILRQQFEISKRNYWVAGIAVVLLLSLLLGYQYYNRAKLRQSNIAMQAIIETEEKERKRIAQDLHDSVSQTMTAAKINLTVVGAELPFINDEQRKRFEKAVNLVDMGFKEVRTISHNMMPWALLQTGLAQVVKQLLENIERDTITINFFSKGFDEHFDDTIEIILYRVLQECVNNVMKHAEASRLDISMMRDEQTISVTIEDNGKGFNTGNPGSYEGIGLKNIQTRISFLKGKIEMDSHPGKGTLLSIYIPLANKNL